MHSLNQATDVVAQHLTQRLVNLRRLRLAPKRVPELRLNHRKRRLDVAALVVVLLEQRPIELVEVIKTRPQFALARRVRLPLFALVEAAAGQAARRGQARPALPFSGSARQQRGATRSRRASVGRVGREPRRPHVG